MKKFYPPAVSCLHLHVRDTATRPGAMPVSRPRAGAIFSHLLNARLSANHAAPATIRKTTTGIINSYMTPSHFRIGNMGGAALACN